MAYTIGHFIFWLLGAFLIIIGGIGQLKKIFKPSEEVTIDLKGFQVRDKEGQKDLKTIKELLEQIVKLVTEFAKLNLNIQFVVLGIVMFYISTLL